MNFSELFIRRPVATVLLMVGVVLAGLLGYSQLPVSSLPPVDFPTLEVRADLPGASPEVMASSVTTPLERQLGQISGLEAMNSTSSFGHTGITLRFNLDRNIDSAAQDVQAALNAAAGVLPRNLPSPPTFSKVNPADPPILTLQVSSDTLPLERVNDFADTILAQKLSQVTGVGLVSIQGLLKPAVRVKMNPGALAAYNLSLGEVRNALVAANQNSPKGSLDGRQQAFAIGVNDQLSGAKAFQALIVAYRNGSPVRLGDLGEVADEMENARQGAWVGGKPAVVVDVQRQPGANIIETVDRLRALIPQLRSSIPPAIQISVLQDRTEMIRASIRDVQFTLVLTVGLVVMVIFVFLRRFWATVIPAAALPLTLLGTFGIMKLAGFSLDNLSLMALTICTGFVVDDAIVMIENIVRLMEQGESPLEAALKGARQIGFTVISLSASLIAVFIPLLFMPGVLGRLFREFSVTLSVAVAVSALISLSLTPMMCASLLRAHAAQQENWLFRVSERAFDALRSLYGFFLRGALRHPGLMLGLTALSVAASFWLYQQVPKGLLPNQDTGLILGVTEAAPTVSFEGMVREQQALVEALSKDPALESVTSFVGGGAVNPTGNTGRLYLRLKPREQRKEGAQEVIQRLRVASMERPGISLFLQAVQDLQLDSRLAKTQYQMTLQHADEEELHRWATELSAHLQKRPEFRDVSTDQSTGGLELNVEVDRAMAAQLNLTTQAINDALYDSFGQRQVSMIFTQLNQYRVILEVEPRFQRQPEALEKVYVKSSSGAMIPLSSVASVRTGTAPLAIHHEAQFPAVTLSFNLSPGVALGSALQVLEATKQDLGFPQAVLCSFSGSTAEFETSRERTPYLLLAAVVVIYIVLGVLYESYVHPLTILSSLPPAGVGALLALLVTGTDLSMVALVGIILLIGIVKKNAIMMIDFALELERERGLSPRESIYEACLLRFRPILMTTFASLFGALPMALERGAGSELRNPLGITIVGGLLVSQLLTLFTTPVIYLSLGKVAAFFRGNHPSDPAPDSSPWPGISGFGSQGAGRRMEGGV